MEEELPIPDALHINNSLVENNIAPVGGGLWSDGELLVSASTISNNNAQGGTGRHSIYNGGGGGGAGGLGGGVAIVGGTASLVQATVSNNVAAGGAGGTVDDWPCPTLPIGSSECIVGFSTFAGEAGGRPNQLGAGGDGGLANGLFRVTGHTLPNGETGLLGGGGGGGAIAGNLVTRHLAGSGGGLRAGAGGIGDQLKGGGGGGGAGAGGGIFLLDGSLSIDSSTITENLVRGGKGGVGVRGTEANPGLDATGTGGGVFVYQELNAELNLGNSIVSGNMADPRGRSDIDGRADSRGHNLVGYVTNTSDFPIPRQGGSDIRVADPQLGPLADHGGIGRVHVPQATSPALDRGDTSELNDGRGVQRGVGIRNDIGAVESHELVVTSLGDSLGTRSLRQALLDAELLPGTNTIHLPAGTIVLTSSLAISSDVILRGAAADQTIIDGSSVDGDLFAMDGVSVDFEALSIVGPNSGRILQIQNQAEVGIVQSELVGGANGVTPGGGSTNGGLILARDSVLNVHRSTLTAGIAAGSGGAISLGSRAIARVASSTIHGSSAAARADAIHVGRSASLVLSQSTIAGDRPDYAGEAIRVASQGQLRLHNTIVQGRLIGSVVSLGHNLVGDDSATRGLVASDIRNVNPRLGELTDNNGATRTVSVAQTSPALDAGDNRVNIFSRPAWSTAPTRRSR